MKTATFKFYFCLFLFFFMAPIYSWPEPPAAPDLHYKSTVTFTTPEKKFTLTAVSCFWLSGLKSRVETKTDHQSIITIINKEGTFYLNPAKKIALKKKAISVNKKTVAGSFDPKKSRAHKIGQEKIGGKPCSVYLLDEPENNLKGKVWLWVEKQFPLKIELTGPKEKMVTVNSEVSFEKIKDNSLFEVPRDYQIIQEK